MKGGMNVISPKQLTIINYLPQGMVKFLAKKILKLYVKKYANIHMKGLEKINQLKEPVIFVCNHLSNADGLILNEILQEKDITFVAGVKLTDNAFTKLGFYVTKTIPIKPNSADKEAISKIISTLKEGTNIVIFPEGTRSRTGKMIEGKKGILLIAKMAKVRIVPIGMWGTEKMLPINDKDMALEKFHHADIHINIGEPIELSKKMPEEDKHDYQERAMRELMVSIARLLPVDYRGVYAEYVEEEV